MKPTQPLLLNQDNIYDSVQLAFYVEHQRLHGFWPDIKAKGDEDCFTLHFQFHTKIAKSLKQREGEVVFVTCKYKDDVLFCKNMKISRCKVVFDPYEIPSLFVTFTV